MKTISTVLWNDNQNVKSFIALCQLVKSADLSFVLGNFGRLTERFYEEALDKEYRCSLTASQNWELETEFAALADWIQNAKEVVLKHSVQVTIKLQVSYVHNKLLTPSIQVQIFTLI
jgi:hypothetical protein